MNRPTEEVRSDWAAWVLQSSPIAMRPRVVATADCGAVPLIQIGIYEPPAAHREVNNVPFIVDFDISILTWLWSINCPYRTSYPAVPNLNAARAVVLDHPDTSWGSSADPKVAFLGVCLSDSFKIWPSLRQILRCHRREELHIRVEGEEERLS